MRILNLLAAVILGVVFAGDVLAQDSEQQQGDLNSSVQDSRATASTADPNLSDTDVLTNAAKLLLRFNGAPGLTSEYRVNADETVSIPVIGRISVTGITAAELEKIVTAKAKDFGGTLGHVTVEILQYRPIYVTGYVVRPGAVEWEPGLNVMKAVALSGGFLRERPAGLSIQEIKRGKAVTEQELSALEGQRTRITDQLDIRRKKSSDIRDLQKKGVVTEERALEEQLKVSDLEERLSNTTVSIARVRALLIDYDAKARLAVSEEAMQVAFELNDADGMSPATDRTELTPGDVLVVRALQADAGQERAQEPENLVPSN